MTGFVLMTADEAVRLRGGDTKVLVCTDKQSIAAFEMKQFAECETLIRDGQKIQYLFDEFMEQLKVLSFQSPKFTTTILLPPNT